VVALAGRKQPLVHFVKTQIEVQVHTPLSSLSVLPLSLCVFNSRGKVRCFRVVKYVLLRVFRCVSCGHKRLCRSTAPLPPGCGYHPPTSTSSSLTPLLSTCLRSRTSLHLSLSRVETKHPGLLGSESAQLVTRWLWSWPNCSRAGKKREIMVA